MKTRAWTFRLWNRKVALVVAPIGSTCVLTVQLPRPVEVADEPGPHPLGVDPEHAESLLEAVGGVDLPEEPRDGGPADRLVQTLRVVQGGLDQRSKQPLDASPRPAPDLGREDQEVTEPVGLQGVAAPLEHAPQGHDEGHSTAFGVDASVTVHCLSQFMRLVLMIETTEAGEGCIGCRAVRELVAAFEHENAALMGAGEVRH